MKHIIFAAFAAIALTACSGNKQTDAHNHEGVHTHEDGTVHNHHDADKETPAQEYITIEESDTAVNCEGHNHYHGSQDCNHDHEGCSGHNHDHGHEHGHDHDNHDHQH